MGRQNEKNYLPKGVGPITQVVKCLPKMYKALGSTPNTSYTYNPSIGGWRKEQTFKVILGYMKLLSQKICFNDNPPFFLRKRGREGGERRRGRNRKRGRISFQH